MENSGYVRDEPFWREGSRAESDISILELAKAEYAKAAVHSPGLRMHFLLAPRKLFPLYVVDQQRSTLFRLQCLL